MKLAHSVIIALLLAILFLMFRRTSGYGGEMPTKKRGFLARSAAPMGSYEGGNVKLGMY